MNNNVLIKKYFERELKPGDRSKDLRIDPQYILVFDGKRPYRKIKEDIALVNGPNKKFFTYFEDRTSMPKIDAVITRCLLEYKHKIYRNKDSFDCRLSLSLARLNLACNIDDKDITLCIDRVNYWYELTRKAEGDDPTDSLDPKLFHRLIINPKSKDLSGLHDDLAIWIFTMKLTVEV